MIRNLKCSISAQTFLFLSSSLSYNLNYMYKFLLFIGCLAFITSCKKEPTTWESDWSAPVAHGHLTIGDLIPVDYTMTNADNYLSLIYHEAIYGFSIDTLIDLPDTTITKKSAVGVNSLNVSPGFSYTDTYDQLYDLDQIELKKVVVKSGRLEVLIKCPWQGLSIVKFTFPKIEILGIPFERIYEMPAGTLANPSIAQEIIDMAGFEIDLTGTSGNLINTLSALFEMGSNETSSSYTITDTDSIEFVISFKDLVPEYAKGYFGQYYFSDTVGFKLDFMKNISGGQIDVDSIDMTITVKNGFNLIAQASITKLTGINTNQWSYADLSFPLVNTSLNINPATGGYYDYVPSEYPISINNTNSNIGQFVENMSDSILLGYELEINPFGNITAGADEFFPGSKMELFLDAEFPLSFGANDVTLVDTFDIDYTSPEEFYPNNGNFVLDYTNGFPLEAGATFYLLDANNQVIDSITSVSIINAGSYNTGTYLTTATNGNVIYMLTEANIANLDIATKVVLHVAFSTDQSQVVRIDANSFFDFTLRTNLNVTVKL